jgi:NhaP-type Na+/H+ or K+/H+ antiporter
MYENFAILAAFIFVYASIAGRLERTIINGAVVFAAFGLIFGPAGLGFLTLSVDEEEMRLIAELTLALVLFTDAANADLGVLKQSIRVPRRLLLLGLPLTILLGFAVGAALFSGLTFFEAAILATMLAATDAALGKAVVTNEDVPVQVRESLNAESGLNDGICVPILFLFLALATDAHGEDSTLGLALHLFAEEIGIGAAVGIGLTVIGALLLKECAKREWVTDTWRQLPVVVLAVACFSVAQSIGGSGFIAAFVGGLLFGWIAGDRKHRLLLAAEGTGDTLALLTWVAFGAIFIPKAVEFFSFAVVLYAVLSLTLIRMLPVFLTLTGTGLRIDEKLFVGWFGPRGLASIVFGVIVLNSGLPGSGTIAAVVAWTILLSVVAHGLSANPMAAALAARISRSGSKSAAD